MGSKNFKGGVRDSKHYPKNGEIAQHLKREAIMSYLAHQKVNIIAPSGQQGLILQRYTNV